MPTQQGIRIQLGNNVEMTGPSVSAIRQGCTDFLGTGTGTSTTNGGTQTGRRQISPAARKKIAEAQRKRWEHQRETQAGTIQTDAVAAGSGGDTGGTGGTPRKGLRRAPKATAAAGAA
jgi:hypothetical protein